MRQHKLPAYLLCKKDEGITPKEVLAVILAVLVSTVCLYVLVSECLFYFAHPDIRRGEVGYAEPELYLAGELLGWNVK